METCSLLCEFSAFIFLVILNVDEIIDPSPPLPMVSVGVKLLRLMGWRGGRQIGPKHIAAASGKDTDVDGSVFHCLLEICGYSEIYHVLNVLLTKGNIQVHEEKLEKR